MQAQSIRVEATRTPEACAEHERLARLVWADDPSAAVAPHLLIAIGRAGGVVLGAYAGDAMVGLLFGVPSIRHGRLMHLSHMLGVHPDWRGRGVGDALKWRQREIVLGQGIDTIYWTFDPLEAANARLNIAHLGGIVRCYTRDYYGPMDDALNRGIPSDRFTVEWLISTPRVEERVAGMVPRNDVEAPVALAATETPLGPYAPGQFREPSGEPVLVEIPSGFQDVKQQSQDLAMAWRLATRDAFERLFARGYVVTGASRRGGRAYYHLERDVP